MDKSLSSVMGFQVGIPHRVRCEVWLPLVSVCLFGVSEAVGQTVCGPGETYSEFTSQCEPDGTYWLQQVNEAQAQQTFALYMLIGAVIFSMAVRSIRI